MSSRWLLGAALAVAVALLAAAGWAWWQLQPVAQSADPVVFEVRSGWGGHRIADELAEEGLVRHPRVFEAWLRLRGLDRSIGEGLYDLGPTLSTPEIARRLSERGRPRTADVVVPEGFTARQLAQRLGERLAGRSEREAAVAEAAGGGPGRRAGSASPARDEPRAEAEARAAPAAGDPNPFDDPVPPAETGAAAAPSADDGGAGEGVAAGVGRDDGFDAERFLAIVAAPGPLKPAYLPRDAGLEGYLFPDTYQWHVQADEEEVVNTMLARFEEELDVRTRQRLGRAGMSVHAWVTLASLVQAEAAGPDEMPIIAGVFRNRLDRAMPLQSDPTVAYGLGKALPELSAVDGDLRVDHAWNTYTRGGLPAGPIGNPGSDALAAVLSPQRTAEDGRPWLYFLHGVDGGEPVFRPNTSLAEHEADIDRFLR